MGEGGDWCRCKSENWQSKSSLPPSEEHLGFTWPDHQHRNQIFRTTVEPVLLYETKTQSTTAAMLKKIQTFINTCPRRIFWIQWPETISNRELGKWTKQQPAEDEILQKCWRWIGHTLPKPMTCVLHQALTWNPQGKRKQVCPRNTWCHNLQAETKRSCYTWGQLERLAHDQDVWRARVGSLCSSRGQRQWWCGGVDRSDWIRWG